MLQACAAEPTATQESAPSEQEPVPELTLNLPDQSDTDCACDSEAADHNLLDKGFRALESGDTAKR